MPSPNSIYSTEYQELIIGQVRAAVQNGEGVAAAETPLPIEVAQASGFAADYFKGRFPTAEEDGVRFYQRERIAAAVRSRALLRATREVGELHGNLVGQALGRRTLWALTAHNSQDPGAVGILHVDEGVSVSFTFNEGHAGLTYAQTEREYNDPSSRRRVEIASSGIGVALGDVFPTPLAQPGQLAPVHRWQELSGTQPRRSFVLGFFVLPFKNRKK